MKLLLFSTFFVAISKVLIAHLWTLRERHQIRELFVRGREMTLIKSFKC